MQVAEIAVNPNIDIWGTLNGTDEWGYPNILHKPQVRARLQHILLDANPEPYPKGMKMPFTVFSCKQAIVGPVYAMAYLIPKKSFPIQLPHDMVELPGAQLEPLFCACRGVIFSAAHSEGWPPTRWMVHCAELAGC
jgi:hypothetical protein